MECLGMQKSAKTVIIRSNTGLYQMYKHACMVAYDRTILNPTRYLVRTPPRNTRYCMYGKQRFKTPLWHCKLTTKNKTVTHLLFKVLFFVVFGGGVVCDILNPAAPCLRGRDPWMHRITRVVGTPMQGTWPPHVDGWIRSLAAMVQGGAKARVQQRCTTCIY